MKIETNSVAKVKICSAEIKYKDYVELIFLLLADVAFAVHVSLKSLIMFYFIWTINKKNNSGKRVAFQKQVSSIFKSLLKKMDGEQIRLLPTSAEK